MATFPAPSFTTGTSGFKTVINFKTTASVSSLVLGTFYKSLFLQVCIKLKSTLMI